MDEIFAGDSKETTLFHFDEVARDLFTVRFFFVDFLHFSLTRGLQVQSYERVLTANSPNRSVSTFFSRGLGLMRSEWLQVWLEFRLGRQTQ
jgi:hypothetical protein